MSDVPYLSDTGEPLSDATDAFGHRDYAAALVHALTRSQPPFTVGLFGDWGVGKSTVLSEVGRQLGREGVIYVQFDAWRYEGEAFRRQFLKDVGRQLSERGLLDKSFDPSRGLRDLYQSVQTHGKQRVRWSKAGSLKLVLFLAMLVALAYLIGMGPGDLFDEKNFKSTTAAGLFLALVGLAGLAMIRVDNTLEVTRDAITQHRLEEPERFTEQFTSMLAAVKAERLVIAIDNLDRLNAEDAVLFLNTVKTYLEPVIESSKQQKDDSPAVVVLIAADDRALRHHLLSRAPSLESDDGARQRYADEYLRKFFNASLPMRPVLADDMREYMRNHLMGYAERWLTLEDLDDLVRIASAGLRHNPRRVKQWVNNLELRTRLIREREEASNGHVARLEPRLSEALTVVAKLALIEEEWPDAFAELQRAPLLLREWQQRADAGSRSGQPDSWRGTGWQECAAFLRATSHISTGSIRPFIRLRRSVAERDLPEYDEVHDALTSNDIERVEEVFGRLNNEDAIAYGFRLEDIVEEELNAGNVDGARAVMYATIMAEPLARSPGVGRVLSRAAVEPDLRDALPQLPLDELAEATVRHVGRVPARAIWARLFKELADDRIADDQRVRLSHVLAQALRRHRIDVDLSHEIKSWVLDSQVRDRDNGNSVALAVLEPVLQEEPSWISAEGYHRAMDELRTSARRFRGAAWEMVLIAIEQKAVPQVLGEEAGLLITNAIAEASETEDTSFLLSPASSYLSSLIEGGFDSGPFALTISRQLSRLWPLANEERAPVDPDDFSWAKFGFLLFQSVAADIGDVAHAVVEHFLTEPLAVSYAVNARVVKIDELSDEQRGLFSDQLAIELLTTVHGDASEAQEIVAAVTKLDPARAADHVADALLNGVQNGYAETVRAIWKSQRNLAIESAGVLAQRFTDKLQTGTDVDTATALLDILPELIPYTAEDIAAHLASVLWPIYESEPSHVTRQVAEQAILAIAERDASGAAVEAWLDATLGDLPSPYDATAERAAALLVKLDSYLGAERRTRLAERLTAWVRDEDVALDRISRVAIGLSGLRVEVALPLTKALMDRDAGLARDSVEDRVPVVQAILHLGESSRSSRLKNEVAAYEHRLATGFPEDAAVLARAKGNVQQPSED